MTDPVGTPMAGARPLGRIRAPWQVAVLGTVTLGLYWAWFYFQAFREVRLHRATRHSALLFLGLVPVAGLAFAGKYVADELRELDAARRDVGLPPGPTGTMHNVTFALLLVPALALALAFASRGIDLEHPGWLAVPVLAGLAPLACASWLAHALREYWRALGALNGPLPA